MSDLLSILYCVGKIKSTYLTLFYRMKVSLQNLKLHKNEEKFFLRFLANFLIPPPFTECNLFREILTFFENFQNSISPQEKGLHEIGPHVGSYFKIFVFISSQNLRNISEKSHSMGLITFIIFLIFCFQSKYSRLIWE